jgi:hypothetical protein
MFTPFFGEIKLRETAFIASLSSRAEAARTFVSIGTGTNDTKSGQHRQAPSRRKHNTNTKGLINTLTSRTSAGLVQTPQLDHRGRVDLLDDKLCDALALLDLERLVAVVEKNHPYVAPVVAKHKDANRGGREGGMKRTSGRTAHNTRPRFAANTHAARSGKKRTYQ